MFLAKLRNQYVPEMLQRILRGVAGVNSHSCHVRKQLVLHRTCVSRGRCTLGVWFSSISSSRQSSCSQEMSGAMHFLEFVGRQVASCCRSSQFSSVVVGYIGAEV